MIKHGYDYNLTFSDPAVRGDAQDQAPNPASLLLSQLLREIADGLTPSRKQNRDEAVKRLKIESLKKEDQDVKLMQDGAYIRGLVLAGAKYLFVDFCGLVLFRALGASLYDTTPGLLVTRSMRPLYERRDLEPMRSILGKDDFVFDDIFCRSLGTI